MAPRQGHKSKPDAIATSSASTTTQTPKLTARQNLLQNSMAASKPSTAAPKRVQMDQDVPKGNPWCAGDIATLGQPCDLESITKKESRKGVSHFFGRNKGETRDIDDECWLRFCRKHYQHALYRSDEMYGAIQCYLVIEQLKIIQKTGKFLYVKLALRLRSDDEESPTASSKKNRNKSSEPTERVRPDGTPMRKKPKLKEPAPLPDWLRAQLRDHVTFEHMMRILQVLHHELEKSGGEMPDIEILPITKERDQMIRRKRENQRKAEEKKMRLLEDVKREREQGIVSAPAITFSSKSKASSTTISPPSYEPALKSEREDIAGTTTYEASEFSVHHVSDSQSDDSAQHGLINKKSTRPATGHFENSSSAQPQLAANTLHKSKKRTHADFEAERVPPHTTRSTRRRSL